MSEREGGNASLVLAVVLWALVLIPLAWGDSFLLTSRPAG